MPQLEDTRPAVAQERETALVHILQRLWVYPSTTRSDDARLYADEIAEAASRQLLTTQVVPNGTYYGRIWKLTAAGLAYLFANSHLLGDEEARYVEVYARG